jgi:hypothetical protein
MTAVVARIVLRYGAAALIMRGLLSPADADTIINDPDLQMLVGVAIGAVAEGWMIVAKRMGWAT